MAHRPAQCAAVGPVGDDLAFRAVYRSGDFRDIPAGTRGCGGTWLDNGPLDSRAFLNRRAPCGTGRRADGVWPQRGPIPCRRYRLSYVLDLALGSNWFDFGDAVDDLPGCIRPPRGSVKIFKHHVWRRTSITEIGRAHV